jgi:hypothetical protein
MAPTQLNIAVVLYGSNQGTFPLFIRTTKRHLDDLPALTNEFLSQFFVLEGVDIDGEDAKEWAEWAAILTPDKIRKLPVLGKAKRWRVIAWIGEDAGLDSFEIYPRYEGECRREWKKLLKRDQVGVSYYCFDFETCIPDPKPMIAEHLENLCRTSMQSREVPLKRYGNRCLTELDWEELNL